MPDNLYDSLASMGPRFGDRGNDLAVAYEEPKVTFASMGPRFGDRGNVEADATIADSLALQWGRGSVTAETYCL